MTRYKFFFPQNELKMNMSSLLNVFNGSNKPEEKNSGISIIAKKNEKEEYLYMSICGAHSYGRLGCC